MGDDLAHRPVLLAEAMEGLAVKPGGSYVDATFGRGGHARALLERLDARGRLLVMDKDPQAIACAREMLGGDRRVTIVQDTFAHLGRALGEAGMGGAADGVLMDLGVSSPQLDDPRRGFSFRHDGPLDMRMDPGQGVGAAQWIARASEEEIATVLKTYGEERYARRIARAIVAARRERPITTTAQLAAIVAAANPAWEKGKDPATRAFQAIRIHINRELEDLEAGLNQAVGALAPGGRLVVIGFHSLEDRLVKRFMRRQARGVPMPRGVPLTEQASGRTLRVVGKARHASAEEVAINPRARSAVLRVAEKLP